MTKLIPWLVSANPDRNSSQRPPRRLRRPRRLKKKRRLLAESLEDRRVLAATVPLAESFEVPTLAALTDWTFATSGGGTAELDTVSAAHSGASSLRFDSTTDFGIATSEAVLEVDLSSVSGSSDLTFDFWMKRLNSSTSPQYFLQVDISGNRIDWATISPQLQPPGNVWINYTYDLDSELANAGIATDNDVFLRLKQQSFHSSHDSIIDDVRVGQFGDLRGPRVDAISPDSLIAGPVSAVNVTFNERIDATSFTLEDVSIYGTDGLLIPLASGPIDNGDQMTFSLNFADPQSLRGDVSVHIGPNLNDIAGNLMNQDDDARNGETAGEDTFFGGFEIGPSQPQTIPYAQDFEVASLALLDGWSFHIPGGGSIELNGSDSVSPSQSLRFNGDNAGGGQAAELRLNLSDQSSAADLSLDFWAMRGATFFGSDFQVSASNDGLTFVDLAAPLNLETREFRNYFFDLDEALDSAGIVRDSDVVLKFEHHGAGLAFLPFDDLRIARRDADGPRIISMTPSGSTVAPATQLQVIFNEAIDPTSFDVSDVMIQEPLKSDLAITAVTDLGDGRTFTIQLSEPVSQPGLYHVAIGPDVVDLSGNPMNQDGDNANGDSYRGTFQYSVTPSTEFPYYQGFANTAELKGHWFFQSDFGGRIQMAEQAGRSVIRMDNPGGRSTNQAILAIDLVGKSGVKVAFNQHRTFDQTTAADALRISDDLGATWHTASMLPRDRGWAGFEVDLDTAVAAAGMAYTDNFWIMVQQFDTVEWPSAGREFDDFRVTTETTAPTIVSHDPVGLIRPPANLQQIDLTFSEPIDVDSFDLSDLKLRNGTGDISDQLVGITGGPTQFGVHFLPQGLGHIELTVGPEILDLAGNPLDQDGDASPGEYPHDQYVAKVDINTPAGLGYQETFANGFPNEAWNFISYGNGEISIIDEQLKLESFDGPLGIGLNRAILHLDLQSQSRFKLHFDAIDNDSSTQSSLLAGTQGDGLDWDDVVAVSDDGGTTWTVVDVLTSGGQKSYDIAAFVSQHGLALVDNFLVMFQQSHPGTTAGNWSIDNVIVEREMLSLTATGAQTAEGTNDSPTITITREQDADLSSPLEVTLTSSDPSELQIVSSVIIPANQQSVEVQLTVVDDTEVDGPQAVRITAFADSVAARHVDFVVGDNEPQTLLVTLDRLSVNESDGPGAATATVTRNRGLDVPLEVTISSSDTSVFTTAATVTIPIGETSSTVEITPHNDFLVDATQLADLQAAADNFVGAIATLQVENDDTTSHRTIGGYFDGVLPKDDYTATFDVQVAEGSVLQISPGAKLAFDPNVALRVLGTVLAEGTAGDEILFVSSAAVPSPGDWVGVDYDASGQSRSVFDHVEIAHAVIGWDSQFVHLPQFTLANSVIHHQLEYGVRIQTELGDFINSVDDVVLERNAIHNNGFDGINIHAKGTTGQDTQARATVRGNELYQNGHAGLHINSSYSTQTGINRSSSASVNVEKNYVHNNLEHGILLTASEFGNANLGASITGSFSNNLVAENQGPGFQIDKFDLADLFVDLVNNTVVDNSGPGIFHSGENFTNVTMRNNLVSSNSSGFEAGEAFSPGSGLFGFNNVFGNTNGNWINYPASFGTATTTNANGTPSDAEFNLSVDPMFAVGSLYVPSDESEVNDAGGFENAPRDDYLGRLRSAPIDIGAYEHDFSHNVVTTLLDENDGVLGVGAGDSLREVIEAATARPGADTITFDPTLTGGTIQLAGNSLPLINDKLHLVGLGSSELTISGTSQSRIFDIGPAGDVVMSDLTIRDAIDSAVFSEGGLEVRDSVFIANVGIDGGAIFSSGSLVVADSEFRSNTATWGGAIFTHNLVMDRSTVLTNTATSGGGGIYAQSNPIEVRDSDISNNEAMGNEGSYSRRGGGGIASERGIKLERSTISNNSSGHHGGGLDYDGGVLSVISDSTIDNNSAAVDGGGIYNDSPGHVHNSTISGNRAGRHGGGFSMGRLVDALVIHATIVENRADADGDNVGIGGGIANVFTDLFFFSSVELHNSIVAGNFRGNAAVADDLTSLGAPGTFNLIGDAGSAGDFVNGVDGNLVGVVPMLSELANHGGVTQTHALLNGSPAIDAGDNAKAVNQLAEPLAFDQRGQGFDRILDGSRSGTATVDIGAFETPPPPVVDLIEVNGGQLQRSFVDHLDLSFDQPVNIDDDGGVPFELINLDTGQAVDVVFELAALQSPSTYLLTFLPGPSVGPGGTLVDGNYRLTLNAQYIHTGVMPLDGNADGSGGDAHIFGAQATDNFFRIFGDSDGNRGVDGQDLGRFGLTFLKRTGDPGFNPAMDSDFDGDVDGADYGRFRSNLFKSI